MRVTLICAVAMVMAASIQAFGAAPGTPGGLPPDADHAKATLDKAKLVVRRK